MKYTNTKRKNGILEITDEEIQRLLDAGINPYSLISTRFPDALENWKVRIWEWEDQHLGREVKLSLDVPSSLVIKGSTYPIKDQLKALGFRWQGFEKYWAKRVASIEEAIELAQKIQEVGK